MFGRASLCLKMVCEIWKCPTEPASRNNPTLRALGNHCAELPKSYLACVVTVNFTMRCEELLFARFCGIFSCAGHRCSVCPISMRALPSLQSRIDRAATSPPERPQKTSTRRSIVERPRPTSNSMLKRDQRATRSLSRVCSVCRISLTTGSVASCAGLRSGLCRSKMQRTIGWPARSELPVCDRVAWCPRFSLLVILSVL